MQIRRDGEWIVVESDDRAMRVTMRDETKAAFDEVLGKEIQQELGAAMSRSSRAMESTRSFRSSRETDGTKAHQILRESW
jgi:hypothetical protein